MEDTLRTRRHVGSERRPSCVCRLVEETKREGVVDVSQAYSKIIHSITEADDAAKMADQAARHAVQVQEAGAPEPEPEPSRR